MQEDKATTGNLREMLILFTNGAKIIRECSAEGESEEIIIICIISIHVLLYRRSWIFFTNVQSAVNCLITIIKQIFEMSGSLLERIKNERRWKAKIKITPCQRFLWNSKFPCFCSTNAFWSIYFSLLFPLRCLFFKRRIFIELI